MDNVVYPRPDADWEAMVEDIRENLRTGMMSSTQMCLKWGIHRSAYIAVRRVIWVQGPRPHPIPRDPQWGLGPVTTRIPCTPRPFTRRCATPATQAPSVEAPSAALPSVNAPSVTPSSAALPSVELPPGEESFQAEPASQATTVEEPLGEEPATQVAPAEEPSSSFDWPCTQAPVPEEESFSDDSLEEVDPAVTSDDQAALLSTEANVGTTPSTLVNTPAPPRHSPAPARHTPPIEDPAQPVLVELCINALPGTKVSISVGRTPSSTVYTVQPLAPAPATQVAIEPALSAETVDKFIREQLAHGIPHRTIANVLAGDDTTMSIMSYLRRIRQVELEDARRDMELGFDTPSTRQIIERHRTRYAAEHQRMREHAREAKRHASGLQKGDSDSDSDKENPDSSVREIY